MSTSAIIVAAGQSRRMGFDKLLAKLGNRPVLAHTLRAFQETPCIDEMVIVTSQERQTEVTELVNDEGLTKVSHIIEGGRHRHDSVHAGLLQASGTCEFIAVHDGARPLIDREDIQRCWELARDHGAAACARRITDTVKRADAGHRVTGSVDRSNLWAMETPQIFSRKLLLQAYKRILAVNALVTDEVSALEAMGEPVMLSECLKPNIKITFPQDLKLAAHLRNDRSEAPLV